MIDKYEILIPESTYHVYNRANGSDKLFLSDDNYRYFLEKYKNYISPIANTFCYCLMPNHFHFLLRIKTEKELVAFFENKKSSAATRQGLRTLDGLRSAERLRTLEGLRPAELSKLLTQQFSHLLNGYSQALNKQLNRKGSLFMHPYKRKRITEASYLVNIVKYIHLNPVEARLCRQAEDWAYSSYPYLLKGGNNLLHRKEIISWFDDLENFIHFHKSSE